MFFTSTYLLIFKGALSGKLQNRHENISGKSVRIFEQYLHCLHCFSCVHRFVLPETMWLSKPTEPPEPLHSPNSKTSCRHVVLFFEQKLFLLRSASCDRWFCRIGSSGSNARHLSAERLITFLNMKSKSEEAGGISWNNMEYHGISNFHLVHSFILGFIQLLRLCFPHAAFAHIVLLCLWKSVVLQIKYIHCRSLHSLHVPFNFL